MVNKTVLDIGVPVVTETVPGVHSVSIGIWVKAGSRYEKKGENGISHFIEHMLFKGTEKHTAREIAKVIDSVGGVLNAFTSKEYTCFYVKILSQHLCLAIDLLSDIFFDSLFKQEEIEKERNVIIQEIHMVKDTPDEYIQDIFNQSYFNDHPLGYSTLGELETVQHFGRNDIVGFFNREYSIPERIIISAAGNIEHQDLLEEIEKRFGHFNGRASEPEKNSFLPERNVSFHYRELEQVHVCLGTAGLSQVDPGRHALYILNVILGGSMSSRLFQEIRENRGLAYSVFSFMASFHDTGLFGVYMGVRNETVKDSLNIVLKEIKELREKKVDTAELCDAKEQIKGNMLLALESTDSRMSRLAKCEMYYNEYIPIEEVMRDIDGVTSETIQELAQSIFRDEYFTYTFLGPVKEKSIPSETLRLN